MSGSGGSNSGHGSKEGMSITATHQDQVNAELLAFLRSSPATLRAKDRRMAAASANV